MALTLCFKLTVFYIIYNKITSADWRHQ